MTDTDEIETEKPKRGPGRPKGLGKVAGSGRQKGTPNRTSVQTRGRIQELADPVKFLAEVMDGKRQVCAGEPGDARKTWAFPTLAQRIQAGEVLLKKLLPDLRATELSGNLQPAYTQIERLIVDPVSEASAPAEAPAIGNGEDKDVPVEERGDSTDRDSTDRAASHGRMKWME